jgi:hypothetical protein
VQIVNRTLEEQRAEFARRRFLAMPLAGTIAWLVVGIAGQLFSPQVAVWTLFIATGSIVYLGLFISRFTGENFTDRSKPKNVFDALFMHSVAQALLVFAIAIPFFMLDYTSLPLSVGILTGLMWVPLSWTIRHWIGWFHTVSRTALIVAAWYAYPDQRFVVIPAIIMAIYIVTMVVLENRWRGFSVAPT